MRLIRVPQPIIDLFRKNIKTSISPFIIGYTILKGVLTILQMPMTSDVNGSTPRARIRIIPIVTAIIKVPIIDIIILLSKFFVLGDISILLFCQMLLVYHKSYRFALIKTKFIGMIILVTF